MIDVLDVTKRYGRTTVVDGLRFTVEPGRVTGFLGPNGAGKSTTMRMIGGLDAPTAGRVTVAGRAYAEHDAPLRTLGMLLEAGAAHPGRTAEAHLRALAAAGSLPRRRVDDVLAMVGLQSAAGTRVGTFSLGMRQRLGIATALLGDPAAVLLDEPVNGLDPDGVRWLRELLRGLAAEGRTVLVSSHLMSEMTLTADHLVIIGAGRLIADEPLEAFVRRAGDGVVEVRSPDAAALRNLLLGPGVTVSASRPGVLEVAGLDVETIAARAAGAGVPVHGLTPRTASLEEAFMELTRTASEYRSVPR
ncbi:ATP-binding cassette domain-containing protein [Cryptosporangium japonicum]|uniref:ABC transporter ATP-binding protein n=1 Tax=Cryptosporangium japonicum TaxID=80872 RepID=A0ABP3DW69_9ACTN